MPWLHPRRATGRLWWLLPPIALLLIAAAGLAGGLTP